MKNWTNWILALWYVLLCIWAILQIRRTWLESSKRNKQNLYSHYLHDIFQKIDDLALRINKLEDRVFGVIDIINNEQLDTGVSFEMNHPLIEQEKKF
jgi:hypothetical protein